MSSPKDKKGTKKSNGSGEGSGTKRKHFSAVNAALLTKHLDRFSTTAPNQYKEMLEINENLEKERRCYDELYDLLTNRDGSKLMAFLRGIRLSIQQEFAPYLTDGRWNDMKRAFDQAFTYALEPTINDVMASTQRRVMHFILLACIVELPSLREYFYPQDLAQQFNEAESEEQRLNVQKQCRVDIQRFQVFYNNFLVPSHSRMLKGLETFDTYVLECRAHYMVCGPDRLPKAQS